MNREFVQIQLFSKYTIQELLYIQLLLSRHWTKSTELTLYSLVTQNIGFQQIQLFSYC